MCDMCIYWQPPWTLVETTDDLERLPRRWVWNCGRSFGAKTHGGKEEKLLQVGEDGKKHGWSSPRLFRKNEKSHRKKVIQNKILKRYSFKKMR